MRKPPYQWLQNTTCFSNLNFVFKQTFCKLISRMEMLSEFASKFIHFLERLFVWICHLWKYDVPADGAVNLLPVFMSVAYKIDRLCHHSITIRVIKFLISLAYPWYHLISIGVLLRSEYFLSVKLNTFTRTSVRESKMNAIAHAQSTFQMLSLLHEYDII